MIDQLCKFTFNVLEIEQNDLVFAASYIFRMFMEKTNFNIINESKLIHFIQDVKTHYNNVPYHNFYHVIHVLNTTYCILDCCDAFEKMNPLIVFATLVSSLTHDIGHNGYNNTFHVNSISELAEKYNNISVLEQHHCVLTFQLVKKWKLLDNLTIEERTLFRNTVLKCILGTDPIHHKNMNDELTKYISIPFVFNNVHDEIELAKYIVHAADLSNPIMEFEICKTWSEKVQTEFKNQAEQEVLLNLPITFSGVINSNINKFADQEYVYTYHICLPYWKTLAQIFPKLMPQYENILTNNLIWNNLR